MVARALSESRSPGYVLFLGAGASASLVSFLGTRLPLEDGTRLLPTSADFLELLRGDIPAQASMNVRLLWEALSSAPYANVEEILRDLDLLRDGQEIAQRIHLAEGMREDARTLIHDCDELAEFVHEKIFEYYLLPHAAEVDGCIEEFWRPILGGLDGVFSRESASDLAVVTTNIDLVVERLFRGEYARSSFACLLDGFSREAYPGEPVWRNDFRPSPSVSSPVKVLTHQSSS